MPYNLLLLPLLGGFLFLHLCHSTRFRAQRLDGYRLLVESAIAGAALLVVGRLLTVLLGDTPPGRFATPLWNMFVPFQYSEASAMALALGPCLALIANVFRGIDKAKDSAVQKHGTALIRLLHSAERQKRMISVTLDSRKWYVGLVAESPNLDPQELYFRLLPVISGYRDKDTLATIRTVFYSDVLQDPTIRSEDFVITLPLKDVKIANLFDENVYDVYFAGDLELTEPDEGNAAAG